jgi:hypothetical protein
MSTGMWVGNKFLKTPEPYDGPEKLVAIGNLFTGKSLNLETATREEVNAFFEESRKYPEFIPSMEDVLKEERKVMKSVLRPFLHRFGFHWWKYWGGRFEPKRNRKCRLCSREQYLDDFSDEYVECLY